MTNMLVLLVLLLLLFTLSENRLVGHVLVHYIRNVIFKATYYTIHMELVKYPLIFFLVLISYISYTFFI